MPSRPRRPHRRLPYFKVQVYDPAIAAWKDERGAFDTIEEAREYIAGSLPKDAETRLMHVFEGGREPLEDPDTFDDA